MCGTSTHGELNNVFTCLYLAVLIAKHTTPHHTTSRVDDAPTVQISVPLSLFSFTLILTNKGTLSCPVLSRAVPYWAQSGLESFISSLNQVKRYPETDSQCIVFYSKV